MRTAYMPACREAFEDVSAGTLAGISQALVGHPLDTVKVRLQTGEGNFSGMRDCIQRTLRAESLGGLYKGVASPIVGAAFQNAAAFLSWGLAKHVVAGDYERLSVAQLFAAGFLSGSCVLFVETPVDLFKTQMQVQLSREGGRFRSVFHCASHIYGKYGLRGCYQGMWANALRFVPGRAVYFSSFEIAERNLTLHSGETVLQTASTFAAGAFAGVAAWTSTYPFDVLRNKIMADDPDIRRRTYRGVWDCAKKTVRTDGVAAFWRGLLPCLLRAGPVNGCVFVVYKTSKASLEGLR